MPEGEESKEKPKEIPQEVPTPKTQADLGFDVTKDQNVNPSELGKF